MILILTFGVVLLVTVALSGLAARSVPSALWHDTPETGALDALAAGPLPAWPRTDARPGAERVSRARRVVRASITASSRSS